jgi:hypothetical protein
VQSKTKKEIDRSIVESTAASVVQCAVFWMI